MRFRRAHAAPLLAVVLPFLVYSCGDTDTTDDSGASMASSTGQEKQEIELLRPHIVPCGDFDAQSFGPSQDAEGDLTIRISVNDTVPQPKLRVVPPRPRVRLGSTVNFQATTADLSWSVKFVGGESPYENGRLRVGGDREAVRPPGEAARITTSAERCGQYVYVLAAYSAELDSTLILDPPLYVRGN